ncbi:hypothetical protein BDV18DRAFT_165351 [Aspergillus unguis]
MFEQAFASCTPLPGSIPLHGAPILVDQNDYEGIHIATKSLSEDFEQVTGCPAELVTNKSLNAETAIIVGSLEKSSLIQSLLQSNKLVSDINGKWESYTTQLITNPVPGVAKGLVIAGSDKRGTIYGIYTLSKQIGVSPWYWWADAPIHKSPTLYALNTTTTNGPPSVKYRGIFINDEAPALAEWAHEKIGPKFNVEFYKKVFELLLRLKANFLWPAMWFGYPHPGSSFFVDDPLNQETADKYGIVMSTSHHEPMQRAMNEWFDEPFHEPDGSWSWLRNREKVRKYFQGGVQRAKPFESVLTMGMRGEGDKAMNEEDPGGVVRDVLSTQRGLIKEVYGKEDGVPQLIALYKEVQEYYENGLGIPDDITLLFADDNFGSVRRLPTTEERKRRGGAGVYYHLEYVGTPRSYKWINSNSCGKVWQQLKHTYSQGADRIWVFNVGDIKPLEVPMTFALSLAWDINVKLPEFFNTFTSRTLHISQTEARKCADLLMKYDRLVALRKHEHIEAETFSVLNYNEADSILSQWSALLKEAENLEKNIPGDIKPCYFQLILHPIKASSIYTSLRITQAKNHLYGLQRRNTTNSTAKQVLHLFDQDFSLSEEYHALLDGKWNHIMRQPHYGYTDTWHAPARDLITGLSFVQARQDSSPIHGFIGVAVEGHPGVRPGLTNEESDRTHPSRRDLVPGVTLPLLERFGGSRYFELFCRGSRAATWTINSPYKWVKVQPDSGTIQPTGADQRVGVSIDWASVPDGFDEEVLLDLRSSLGDFEQVHCPVNNRIPPPDTRGFVEADGYVSVHATSFKNESSNYRIVPYVGRTPTGSVALTHPASDPPSEWLEYPFITFTPAKATLILEFTFTLDTAERPLTYDIQLDGSSSTHRLIPQPSTPGQLPEGWKEAVMDCVWKRRHSINLEPGQHILRIKLGGANCLLEKILIDFGGLRESYLGPPESVFYEG